MSAAGNTPVPPVRRTDEPLYEIVAGEWKELPKTARELCLGSMLGCQLATVVRSQSSGRVHIYGLFDLAPAVDRSRRPDVAFVSYDRWPRTG